MKNPESISEKKNQEISEKIRQIHEDHPDMGYRRIRDELDRRYDTAVNDKRVLRLCRKNRIQSTIKWKPKSCTRATNDPEHIARNYLNRNFHADAPNDKWLTDVTEFKYYVGTEIHKVYLSAILDLYDRRIVAFQISNRNDNLLVMSTFDEAVRLEPEAHPLFHSDRGLQYTSKQFSTRLKKQQMKQSMSRKTFYVTGNTCRNDYEIYPLLQQRTDSEKALSDDPDGVSCSFRGCSIKRRGVPQKRRF